MRRLLIVLPAIVFGCSLVVDVDRFNSGGPASVEDSSTASDTPEAEAASDSTSVTDSDGTVDAPPVRRPQVFVAGGSVEGTHEKSVLRAEISAAGDVTAWAASGDLPASSTATQAARSGSNVFIVGPDFITSDAVTVRFAKLDADGKLSTWAGQKTLTPHARVAAAASTNHVYAIGGNDGTTNNGSSDVFLAPILGDGSPGAFAAARSLPEPRGGPCAVVVGENLYVMGGYVESTTGLTSTIRAPIGSDGSLGNWVPQGEMPFSTTGCSAVAVGQRIFVLGGYGAQSRVQQALIGPGGDVGPWAAAGNMPSPHAYFQAVVAGGYVVAAAGFDAASAMSRAVEIAPISEAGIGTWKATTSLPKGRSFVNAFGFD